MSNLISFSGKNTGWGYFNPRKKKYQKDGEHYIMGDFVSSILHSILLG